MLLSFSFPKRKTIKPLYDLLKAKDYSQNFFQGSACNSAMSSLVMDNCSLWDDVLHLSIPASIT